VAEFQGVVGSSFGRELVAMVVAVAVAAGSLGACFVVGRTVEVVVVTGRAFSFEVVPVGGSSFVVGMEMDLPGSLVATVGIVVEFVVQIGALVELRPLGRA
jgi:hypothetical protein